MVNRCNLDEPVFVVGSPRSGTTWVQRLLVAHPQVCGGQESHFFEVFADALGSLAPVPAGQRAVGLACYFTEAEFHDIVRDVWRRMMRPVAEAKPAATVLVEKTPDHSHYVRESVRLFPAARFVHVIRDSRAAVASMLAASRSDWGRNWAPKDARAAAIKWFRSVRDARQAAALVGPGRYLEVHYEDMLADPIGQTARLYDFAGVRATPDELKAITDEQQFEKQKSRGGTPIPVAGVNAGVSHATVEPAGFFNSGKADAWRTSLSHWQKLVTWRYTRKLMREYGYTFAGTPRSRQA